MKTSLNVAIGWRKAERGELNYRTYGFLSTLNIRKFGRHVAASSVFLVKRLPNLKGGFVRTCPTSSC